MKIQEIIKAKSQQFISMVSEIDRGVTRTPVSMESFNNYPIFYSRGGVISYSSTHHTYWGALVGCVAKCIQEMSGVTASAINMPLYSTELQEDPLIKTLLVKAGGMSGNYSRSRECFDIKFGDEGKDESKTDIYNYCFVISEFDFLQQQENGENSLGNAIRFVKMMDEFDLFVALFGDNGKIYKHLSEINVDSLDAVVLNIIDRALDKLIAAATSFFEEVKVFRD